MYFHVIPNVGAGSYPLPPGKWVAVGIACSSDLDCCLVNGQRLGPQAIVPCSSGAEVKGLRGVRTQNGGGALDGGEAFETERCGSNLVLQLYECGDLLVPPGPRAPVFATGKLTVNGGYAEVEEPPAAAVPASSPQLALRLPMSGRSHAVVTIAQESGGGDATINFRGVRYRSAEPLRAENGTGTPSIVEEVIETFFDGQVEQPSSTLAGSDLLGRTFYFGGSGDFAEGFDELEVWLSPLTEETETVFVIDAEASGERNR